MPVNHTSIQLALRAVVLSLDLLPAAQAWENIDTNPAVGVPYVEEDYVPATVALLGLTPSGYVETRGLYMIRWYGVANSGLGDLTAGVDALLALFPPESTIVAATGEVIRIRGDVAPTRSQIRQIQPGRAMIAVTIPWRIYTDA